MGKVSINFFYFNQLFISKSKMIFRDLKRFAYFKPFYDGGPSHLETSPLICSENQCSGFYMVGTSLMKELNKNRQIFDALISGIYG